MNEDFGLDKYSIEEELDQILTISEEEMEVIGNIRQQLLKLGGDVLGDVTEIDKDKIIILFSVSVEGRDEVVTINRNTLKFEL